MSTPTRRTASPTIATSFSRSEDLSERRREELIEDLWQACKEHHRERDYSDPDNGLGVLAERTRRKPHGVLFRVTIDLFQTQPFGVIYGTGIRRRVHKKGTAIISQVYPRSKTVAEHKMPQRHMATKIVPTPIWLDSRDAPYKMQCQ